MCLMYRYGEILYSLELLIMGFISFLYMFPDVMEKYVIYYSIMLVILNLMGLAFRTMRLSTKNYIVVHTIGLIGVILVFIFPLNYIFSVSNMVINWKKLTHQAKVAYHRWESVNVEEVRQRIKRKYGEDETKEIKEKEGNTKENTKVEINREYLEGYVPKEKDIDMGNLREDKVLYNEDDFNKVELTNEEEIILQEETDYGDVENLTLPLYYKKYIDGEDDKTLDDLFGDD